MKSIILKGIMTAALGIGLTFSFLEPTRVFASEGDMVTITINASDDNSGLQYALDSDDPSAFTDSNTFTVPAGTEHTVYVKDAAGNITSQKYVAPSINQENGSYTETTIYSDTYTYPENSHQDSEVEIDLGFDEKENYRNYEYITDTVIENIDQEPEVYVQSKKTTDGTDTAEKVFYTVETASGEQFYLIIEQGNSNKVHFLNQVTTGDLMALAEESEGSTVGTTKEEPDNLLAALQSENGIEETDSSDTTSQKEKTTDNSAIIIILVAAAVGGAYYYLKIYKNKKNDAMDAMDAMDLEEFEREEEEEEELDFDLGDKEALLDELIQSESEEYIEKKSIEEPYSAEFLEEVVTEQEIEESETQIMKDEVEKVAVSTERKNSVDEEIMREIEEATAYDPDLDGEEE